MPSNYLGQSIGHRSFQQNSHYYYNVILSSGIHGVSVSSPMLAGWLAGQQCHTILGAVPLTYWQKHKESLG